MARVHRTTTTATLLVTVAVSALSGCMTVQRPLAPGPATAPAGTAPRPVGTNETQIVQAPASEALEMVGTPRPPAATASPSHRAGRGAAPDPDPADGRNGQPRSARPEPDRAVPPRRPPVELPDITASVRPGAGGGADLCALGREYGGWRADSPEAAICQDTYGR
ncbi:hypothetical protein HTV45_24175 [Streptomyces sp. CHD11]|uniref:hypothetical protein n=1 Tax=Streptomyces sp. CHD11 TaxID=2741325 RepID=UPI001BFC5344|nr:hypothetical protein [Streptomyces sp. CHD11]MBT3153928.1 hypothetical protein [Streptomyces sp. CHD11]